MELLERLEKIIKKPEPDFRQLERVLRRKEKPEYVPFYELYLDVPVMEKILGKKIPNRAATVEFYYKAGYDYVPAWPTFYLEQGSLIDASKGYPISDWSSFGKYQWPAKGSVEFSEFEQMIPTLPQGMKIIGQVHGIFEAAQTLTGYTPLCCMLYDEPELVQAIFENLWNVYEEMYKGMAAIPEVGAIVISDDLGFNTQTLISPAHIRAFIIPYYQRLVEIIHNSGKPCIMHSCGQLSAVMDDLIDDVKIDAKHSFEDSILPVDKAMELYGDRIAIMGGIDVGRLCTHSEKEIREYTAKLIYDLGSTGRYAVGSGNSIAHYVPAEHYLAMIDEAWKCRRL